jgi:lipopolysaccharide transport system ATP-binding protein
MSQPIIQVKEVSKRYRLGLIGATHLREELAKWWDQLKGRHIKEDVKAFWALREISFDVEEGDIIGIIGHNGAGKSTLLKILSRITTPTTGEVRLRGRVASLLEVGTGFHPELTGRENVFLNGTILGMTRPEIRKSFDAIVAFAEIDPFIDTPVKRYSSGMYVRLAFAVAAHLKQEIMIVDEVLAVGDALFQKKCLDKMEALAKQEGRTILMVSHNMSAVRRLCLRGLFLDHGRILVADTLEACMQHYLRDPSTENGSLLDENRSGDGRIRFTGFFIENDRGERIRVATSGEPCTLVFTYSNNGCSNGDWVDVGFGLHALTGERLLLLYASHLNQTFQSVHASGQFRCRLPSLPLATGRYKVYPRIEVNGVEADFPQNGIDWLDIQEYDFYGTGLPMGHHGHAHAPYLTKGEWVENGD